MKCHFFGPFLAICAAVSGCARSKPAEVPVEAPPAPASPSVDITADPSHHLAVENQYVRAFRVEVTPNTATLKHRHDHDYVSVTFGPAELSTEVEGKPPFIVKLEDGQVRFTEGSGPPHLVRNLASTPFRNITIELLQPSVPEGAPAKWDEEHGISPFRGGTREVLLVKGGVRVTKIDLHPGGVLPNHDLDSPHFVVAVSDVDLRDAAQAKGAHAVQLKAGDAKWEDAGPAYKIMNKGKQDAKVVLLEFKP
jgi:quercetin dioxygenase-like cupin family protein